MIGGKVDELVKFEVTGEVIGGGGGFRVVTRAVVVVCLVEARVVVRLVVTRSDPI